MKARKIIKRITFSVPKGYFLIKEGRLREGDMIIYKNSITNQYELVKCVEMIGTVLRKYSVYQYVRPKSLRGLYSNFLDWCERKLWTA